LIGNRSRYGARGRLSREALYESGTRDDRDLSEWFEREQIGGLVVGLPLHTTGREGTKAAEARSYGEWLTAVTGLPVVYADERFSTAFAESALWAAGLTGYILLGTLLEERDLVAHFGAAYRTYATRVPPFFPSVLKMPTKEPRA
jgi:putative transcription antitermination factor YqgF